MSETISPLISEAQQQQYHEKGFFVLERVIPDAHLQMLRDECARLIAETNAEMDRQQTNHMGLSFRDSRYFISTWERSLKIREFMFSDLMAGICRAMLGETASLVFEQYIVKYPEKGMKFSWHQDSGYVPHPHRPYLSCWCALDDVNEENGTVYLLPYERAGTRDRVEHIQDPEIGDLIGYTGDDPGDPIIAPAGSIALFSSTVFHRSGMNTSKGIRRVLLPQYSAEPILNEDGTPQYLCEAFLRDGVRVRSA